MNYEESIQLLEEMGEDKSIMCPHCNSILTRKKHQINNFFVRYCFECNRSYSLNDKKELVYLSNNPYVKKWVKNNYGSDSKYKDYLALKNGFKNRLDYLNNLYIKKGFKSFSDYANTLKRNKKLGV